MVLICSFYFFFYLPEDHSILVDALLALQRVQRRYIACAIAGDPARGSPELRRETSGIGWRGAHPNPARQRRAWLPPGPRTSPCDAERAEDAEQAIEDVLHASSAATSGAGTCSSSSCSISSSHRWPRGPGGDHDDARGDGERNQALVLPSAAARSPTAGA